MCHITSFCLWAGIMHDATTGGCKGTVCDSGGLQLYLLSLASRRMQWVTKGGVNQAWLTDAVGACVCSLGGVCVVGVRVRQQLCLCIHYVVDVFGGSGLFVLRGCVCDVIVM
jgi:hypothetical protein